MNTQEAIRAPGADPKNATGTVRLLQQNGSIAAYLPQSPSQRQSHKQFLTHSHLTMQYHRQAYTHPWYAYVIARREEG